MTGRKNDAGKPRWSLVPVGVMKAVIRVLEIGAAEYGTDNWKSVENARERYYNAAMRHVQDWWEGEELDRKDGQHHLAHAICCFMFLLATAASVHWDQYEACIFCKQLTRRHGIVNKTMVRLCEADGCRARQDGGI